MRTLTLSALSLSAALFLSACGDGSVPTPSPLYVNVPVAGASILVFRGEVTLNDAKGITAQPESGSALRVTLDPPYKTYVVSVTPVNSVVSFGVRGKDPSGFTIAYPEGLAWTGWDVAVFTEF